MGRASSSWFAIRRPMPSRWAITLKFSAFLVPLGFWALISYAPFIWHPWVRVTHSPPGVNYQVGETVKRTTIEEVNAILVKTGREPVRGDPANPDYMPAPHEVAVAFVTSLTEPPAFKDVPSLPWALWHSCQIIFWGFVASAVIGVPLGILCGTVDFFSKLIEPFVDFVRYMPAPAFTILCLTLLGSHDGPKIAIIWIGTFFQMVLVVANTTREFDPALLEACANFGRQAKFADVESDSARHSAQPL